MVLEATGNIGYSHEEEERTMVNQLLERWQSGDREAYDEVFAILFEDFSKIARRQINNERSGHTMQTGDLVSKLYLKLLNCKNKPWKQRTHFKHSASYMMKQILVDHARAWIRRADGKAGIPMEKVGDIGDFKGSDKDLMRLLSLKSAIDKLDELDPQMALIAYMRVVHGYTLEQIAEHLQTAPTNVKREWNMIKKILSPEMLH